MPIGFVSPGHLLGVLFVLVLGWSLVDAAFRRCSVRGRVDCLWHAAMSAAMVVMVAAPGAPVPVTFWTLLFGAGTAWFAVAAVRLLPAGPWGAGAWGAGSGRVRVSGAGSAGVAAGHAVMCALMVGMAWAMELMGHTGGGTGAAGPGVAGHGVAGLGGLGSDGHSAAHHGGALTVAGTADPQAWLQLACLVGAAVLLWLGAGMLVGHVRNARRRRGSAPATGSLLASLAMAAGMAVAFVQMI